MRRWSSFSQKRGCLMRGELVIEVNAPVGSLLKQERVGLTTGLLVGFGDVSSKQLTAGRHACDSAPKGVGGALVRWHAAPRSITADRGE